MFLFLRGNVLTNNSIVFFTEIGETYNHPGMYQRIPFAIPTSLQCITDKKPCCLSMSARAGHWFFPDRTRVNHYYFDTEGNMLYRDRTDDGSVNLNRGNDDVMSPTGLYCCILPDALRVDHTLCANIGM